MGAVTTDLCYWKLAKEGVSLLLNNKQEEAEALFNMYPENIHMYAGLGTIQFMDALMTFEEERLNQAIHTLKEMERRCSGTTWFKISRSKSDEDVTTYADYLETQIIRADAEMYLATLTFLQHDISAYFKGGWMLRKSWKHYQQTYNEISSLYAQIVDDDDDTENENVTIEDNITTSHVSNENVTIEDDRSKSCVSFATPIDSDGRPIYPESMRASVSESLRTSEEQIFRPSEATSYRPSEASTSRKPFPAIIRNGYIPKSHTMYFTEKSTDVATPNSRSSMKKSQSMSSTLSRYNKNLGRLSSPLNSSLSYISSLNPFNTEGVKNVNIDKETIKRLMCGVSFGYGLMQLGMSLMPPSIVRLTSILGFQGNKASGLANLNYARTGTDIRAPLATLALLWYHTIVRPFYALDGNNVNAGVEAADKLIAESMEEYADSAIFLFFRGRAERLKSDIPSAILSFEASIQNSRHREVRVVAQHEVAWCHLIQINFPQAYKTFQSLRQMSRWSRPFYTYLYVTSSGAAEAIQDMPKYEEVKAVFGGKMPKGAQLDEFLVRRYKICPATKNDAINTQPIYWRLLVYELIYLWNSMPSCNSDNIRGIVQDCEDAINSATIEPFVGLAALMAGNGYGLLNDNDNAIRCFRICIQKRKGTLPQADDAHISAFALYELGSLLIKNPHTKAEGKQCLHQVNSYKGYDFEQRLSVRIHSMLKQL